MHGPKSLSPLMPLRAHLPFGFFFGSLSSLATCILRAN